jgi:hypothetical protein
MLPVLIVCFKRPLDLEKMLVQLAESKRRVYVFIDRATSGDTSLNKQVIDTAEAHSGKLEIFTRCSDSNLGVGAAVPAAINWIQETESHFIVLEDDCHLNENGFNYFESTKHLLDGSVALISATSPWDLPNFGPREMMVSISDYPLISGWATSARNWQKVSKFIGQKTPYTASIACAIRRPRMAIAISFFLAAHARNHRGSIGAWDCTLSLGMLLGGECALIPDITMVTNTGRDSVASHTKPKTGEDTYYRVASLKYPNQNVSLATADRKLTNKAIESRILGMRKRHLLSAVKAAIHL